MPHIAHGILVAALALVAGCGVVGTRCESSGESYANGEEWCTDGYARYTCDRGAIVEIPDSTCECFDCEEVDPTSCEWRGEIHATGSEWCEDGVARYTCELGEVVEIPDPECHCLDCDDGPNDDGILVGQGTVTVEGVDAFGKVRSAIFLHLFTDADDHERVLLLSNRGNLCERMRQVQPPYHAAYNTYWNSARECADQLAWLPAIAEAIDPIMANGAHFLALHLNGNIGEPTAGTWGPADALGFGLLQLHDGNLWADQAANLDASCQPIGTIDYSGYQDYEWTLGEVTFDSVTSTAVTGSLAGNLEDDPSFGTVTAMFEAEKCEVDLETVEVLAYYGYF